MIESVNHFKDTSWLEEEEELKSWKGKGIQFVLPLEINLKLTNKALSPSSR